MFGNICIVGYFKEDAGDTFCIPCTRKYGGYSEDELDEETGLPLVGAVYDINLDRCEHCDNCQEPLGNECHCCRVEGCEDPKDCQGRYGNQFDCPQYNGPWKDIDDIPEDKLLNLAHEQDERFEPGQGWLALGLEVD